MEYLKPAEIERKSMEIIREELSARGIQPDPEFSPVIERVIHTTADFDYAETLRFTEHAVQKGTEALLRGVPIVTDTNMALAGISKPALTRLGGSVNCFMADPEIARRARENGTTRAAAAAAKAAACFPEGIFASGNAPTFLLELTTQMDQGFRPALVIAVPVGFVNVTEAKELLLETCLRLEVPAIAAMGRKGGSNVAAAICNALLYLAADLQDPAIRGW